MNRIDKRASDTTRARYQRIAPVYDLMETLPEQRFKHWRKRLWSLVEGSRVLEVGVGTGKNMPFYPKEIQVTAVDLTPAMLERASNKARELKLDVDLRLGDVQELEFPASSFDSIVATFVFCSVADAQMGLGELRRIIKPGGKVLMIEHVRSKRPLVRTLMDLANPLVVRLMGANINRRTVDTVRQSGLSIIRVENLGFGDIFKLIVASKPS